ncbi:MAG: hypothetical protein HZB26_21940 [Candidatus Hydrogenedentes bacterium]|nr:hypothetical protein [Candidatus Hydrogenedentota bacterium]
MLTVPLEKPQADIDHFVKVIRGQTIPSRPPLVELFLDYEVEREISRNCLGRAWVEPGADQASWKSYLKNRIEVYHRMGYDYVRVTGGLDFPSAKTRPAVDTANLSRGTRNWAEEGKGLVSTWDEFDAYRWPDPDQSDLWQYEFVAENLPDGMGMFVCPTGGFLEMPQEAILGYQNMCYLLCEDPDLVATVFRKTGEIIYRFYERLIELPKLYGFFQGDDMGYKSGTLIAPDHLRQMVLPWHKRLAELAHGNGLLYLLHSCGNLDAISRELVDDVGIDGRHSFEDESNNVIAFKQSYGKRTAVLGGVDVDKLARLPESELRAYTRQTIEACMPGGRYALGSGNTVCNYVPIPNYFAMVEEALNYT